MNEIDQPGRILESHHRSFAIEALATVLEPELVSEATAGIRVRNCKLPPVLTAWFVILLGVYRNLSYENLLAKLADCSLATECWKGKPPGRSAVPGARARLGIAPMRQLFQKTARLFANGSQGEIVAGRRVVGLDGSTYKVPDSAANDAYFGRPRSTRGRTGFPQLRMVKLVDVETRIVRDAEYGTYSEGELTLARRLMLRIDAGSLVLMDRGYQAFDFLFSLKEDRRADFVVRVNKKMRCRVVQTLAQGDDLVEVEVPRSARHHDPRLRKTWILRRIHYRIGEKHVVLLTTILDPNVLPRDDVARLYHERWECETLIDEIKTHLCGCTTVNRPVVFRSESPEAVQQEIYGLLIAYNTIRKLMAVAAERARAEPRRLSFVACVERIREAVPAFGAARTEALPRLYRQLLDKLAHTRVPERPGRHDPRAVKIKMSNYPLRKWVAA